MAKTDQDYERRLEAVRLAVAAGPRPDLIATAAAIYAFTTDGAVTEHPTSAPKTTSTPAADAGGQSTGADTASPAPSTTADAGNSPAEGSGAAAPDASNQAATDDAQDGFDGDVAKLQAKCTALAQRDGPGALLEAFKGVGAGKWSEVPAEKYGDLYAAISAKGV